MFVLKSKHESIVRQLQEVAKGEVESLNSIINKQALEIEELKRFKGVAELQKIDSLNNTIDELEDKISLQTKKTKDLLVKYREYKRRIDYYSEINSIKTFVQSLEGHGSGKIKSLIKENKEKQKDLVRNSKAWTIFDHITFNNDQRQGHARQKRAAKFIFSAFNAEVDNIISLCKATNLSTQYKKILKEYGNANKFGEDSFSKITFDFVSLRLQELALVYKYHLQLAIEKEDERIHREKIAEENKVQKEIEKFVKKREKEEREYKNRLLEAEKIASELHDEQLERMQCEIEMLKSRLKDITAEKERALSMAQLTRSGYVYIISNYKSFGENVYKIGMTRRLDPLDRVKELGDASVPFPFEIHGIIQCDDAPQLESNLHKAFNDYRVNTDNFRKEFFNIPIEAIQEQVELHHGEYDLLDRMTIEGYDPEKLGI